MTVKRAMKNQRGFTLAETLLAVLILLLVSTIVATGVPVARNVYNNVVLGANAQVLLTTAAEALRDELGTAWDVTAEDNKVTYFNADTQQMAQIALSENKIVVNEYVEAGGRLLNNAPKPTDGKAADYSHDLLPKAAATNGMSVVYESVERSADENVVEFTNLQVKGSDETVLASLDKLVVGIFSAGTDTISAPMPTKAPGDP